MRLLEELGAITTDEQATAYKLTPLGRQLSQLPVDPRLARMVLEAQKHGCVREAMIITSALSIQDPRERPMDKQQVSDEKHRRFHDKESDFLGFAEPVELSRRAAKSAVVKPVPIRQCKLDFLNYLRVREWQDIYTQLRQVVKELGIPVNSEPAEYREIHVALLTGLLSHIGMKDTDKQEFLPGRVTLASRSSRVQVYSKNRRSGRWSRGAGGNQPPSWGRIAARIDPEWVEPVAQHLIKRSYSEPHWERAQGAVMATEKVIFWLTDSLRPVR